MAEAMKKVWLVDPDGTVRDYPEDHYHVQAAREGRTLGGELSNGQRLEDRTYRLATAEEVQAVLDRLVEDA